MVNVQYPHILQIKDEDTGNWTDLTECRDQPNDKGRMITLGDGINYQYGSVIYAPAGIERLLTVQDIKVIGERGEKRQQAEVKRFSADSLHTRIWI